MTPTIRSAPLSSSPRPTRRSVAKGAVWATPVIALGQVAPASAASPIPVLTIGGSAEWNNASWAALSSQACTNGAPLVFDGRAPNTDPIKGNPQANYTAVFFHSSTGAAMPATTQVCSLSMTFYSPVSTTWVALTGSNTNWSTPTAAGTTVYNGVTYYAYTSTFLSGSCFQLGTYAVIGYSGWNAIYYGWRSTTCYTSRPGTYFRLTTSATVSGRALTKDAGWASMG